MIFHFWPTLLVWCARVAAGHFPKLAVEAKIHVPNRRDFPAAVLLVLILGAAAFAQNPVSPKRSVELAFDRYYDYDEMVAAMRKIAAAHPDLVTLESIGKSYEGRELWLATVAARSGAPLERRPAMWIDGNVHGNEVQGGEVCSTRSGTCPSTTRRTPKVRELIDRASSTCCPRRTPTGATGGSTDQHGALVALGQDADTTTMATASRTRIRRRSRRRRQITQMRKRVEKGGTHVSGSRRPAGDASGEAGQDGHWVLLGDEGIDNDGDGRINEDGPGGYDMNRNWPERLAAELRSRAARASIRSRSPSAARSPTSSSRTRTSRRCSPSTTRAA